MSLIWARNLGILNIAAHLQPCITWSGTINTVLSRSPDGTTCLIEIVSGCLKPLEESNVTLPRFSCLVHAYQQPNGHVLFTSDIVVKVIDGADEQR